MKEMEKTNHLIDYLIDQALKKRFAGSTVTVPGKNGERLLVMKDGVLIGQRGRLWWKQKIEKHKRWLRWKGKRNISIRGRLNW